MGGGGAGGGWVMLSVAQENAQPLVLSDSSGTFKQKHDLHVKSGCKTACLISIVSFLSSM